MLSSLRTLFVGLLALSGGYLLGFSERPLLDASDDPTGEVQITCYKEVQNGTANVICPDTVYAPDSVVNITVKHCREYEYRIDEEHPCR